MVENRQVYVGGCEIGYGGFKRNKRDIIKDFKHEGIEYNLVDNYNGFYNKALVYIDKNDFKHEILISYNTIVAEKIDNKIYLYGYYSQTTAKHINTFLEQHGLKGMCKRDIENNVYKPLECMI